MSTKTPVIPAKAGTQSQAKRPLGAAKALHRSMLLGTISRQALSFDQVTRPRRVVMTKTSGQGSTEQQLQELLSTVARAKPLATVPCDSRFTDRDAANRYRASVNAPLLPEPAASGEAHETLEGAETEQAPATADRSDEGNTR